MQAFTDASDLVDDTSALREQFDRDGYVLVRGAVPVDVLLQLRRDITEVCRRRGWLQPGTDPMEARPAVEPRVEGEDLFFEVYDDVQRLESFHRVPHEPSLRRVVAALLGDTAFPHPLGIARLSFPDNDEWATPPHQDYPNNQGTTELFACWMPLADCPPSHGALTILRGSHRLGLLPLEVALGAGHRQAVLDARHEELEWVTGEVGLGDVLVFHSLTVHRAMPNHGEGLRLSVDYRFQREGDTLTEGCLEPHFGRLSWDEIYDEWERDDLKYYWRSRDYAVAPWDNTMFEVSEEELERQIREFVTWRFSHPPVGAPGPPS